MAADLVTNNIGDLSFITDQFKLLNHFTSLVSLELIITLISKLLISTHFFPFIKKYYSFQFYGVKQLVFASHYTHFVYLRVCE
jgi:hypothetical protein